MTITYFDSDGTQRPGQDHGTVPARGGWSVYQNAGHLPDNFGGSATITSGRPITAVINQANPAFVGAMSYTAFASGSNTIYIPAITKNPYGSWTTGINIKNISSKVASTTVLYYNADGTLLSSESKEISGNGKWDIYLANEFGAKWASSAVITANQPIVAVVNEIHFTGAAESYGGFSSGSTVVNLPVILNRANGGWITSVSIQNTTEHPAGGTINYFDGGGALTKSQAIGIPGRGCINLQMPNGLPDGFAGSAVITMDRPVVAVVSEVSEFADALGYQGVAVGAAELNLPLNGSTDAWTTLIGIQNFGTFDSAVTVTYYDGNGVRITSENRNIPARGSWELHQEYALSRQARSVQIVSSSPVAVVVNEVGGSSPVRKDGQTP